jgi:hypothetical protein
MSICSNRAIDINRSSCININLDRWDVVNTFEKVMVCYLVLFLTMSGNIVHVHINGVRLSLNCCHQWVCSSHRYVSTEPWWNGIDR